MAHIIKLQKATQRYKHWKSGEQRSRPVYRLTVPARIAADLPADATFLVEITERGDLLYRRLSA